MKISIQYLKIGNENVSSIKQIFSKDDGRWLADVDTEYEKVVVLAFENRKLIKCRPKKAWQNVGHTVYLVYETITACHYQSINVRTLRPPMVSEARQDPTEMPQVFQWAHLPT